jgi:ABC-type lipoprotein release transport system permease subunit
MIKFEYSFEQWHQIFKFIRINIIMEAFSSKIFKQGNSFCVVIPKKVRMKLDLKVGDKPILMVSKNGCSNKNEKVE